MVLFDKLVGRKCWVRFAQALREPVNQLWLAGGRVGDPDVYGDIHVVDGAKGGAFLYAAGVAHLDDIEVRMFGNVCFEAVPETANLLPVLGDMSVRQVDPPLREGDKVRLSNLRVKGDGHRSPSKNVDSDHILDVGSMFVKGSHTSTGGPRSEEAAQPPIQFAYFWYTLGVIGVRLPPEAAHQDGKETRDMPRFNVDFSDEATAVLDELAAKQGTTKSDVIRRAIALQKWFEETRDAGSKVLVELPDGRQREIVPL